MEDVFPGCLTNVAFMNALLFSILQTIHKGNTTFTALTLRGRALRNLQNSLLAMPKSLTHAEVGAVLVLHGAAYRWKDYEGHKAHSSALMYVRGCHTTSTPCLTPLGMRAMFWQELTASLVLRSTWQAGGLDMPQVHWRRESPAPRLQSSLPIGFVNHADILPLTIRDCVEDILEMRETINALDLLQHANSLHIDNMLASIESRLGWGRPEYGPPGSVAECVRLALLITCFLSFSEVWANSLIPSRLSENLLDRLTSSMQDVEWVSRRDMQLWCVLAGSSVTILEPCFVESLPQRWQRLLNEFRTSFKRSSSLEMNATSMTRALTVFVHCEWWISMRANIKGWLALESDLLERKL